MEPLQGLGTYSPQTVRLVPTLSRSGLSLCWGWAKRRASRAIAIIQAMEDRPRSSSEAQAHATNIDHTLKELQRKVREYEAQLDEVGSYSFM